MQPPFVIPATASPESSPVPDDAMTEWHQVMQALEGARRFNLHRYRLARLLSWDQRGVALGFTPEQFDLWADAEKERELQDFLSERYGRPVAVSVRQLSAAEAAESGASRSVEDLERADAAKIKTRKREEVLGNPAYIMLKERFQPVNVEIDTDV
jgi:hypothetical protein